MPEQSQTDPRDITASGVGPVAAGTIYGPVYGGGNKVIQLAPPPEIDLAAAERRLAELPVDGIPEIATLPAGSSVPFRPNPLFCGRAAELREVAAALKPAPAGGAPAVAITGMGGVGKSQLTVEFAHRYGRYFVGGVYWISFAEPGAIAAEITNSCSGLRDLPVGLEAFDAQTQLSMILGAWQNDLPRLLIFDNCEDEALLEQWRPATGGARVLLTSRRGGFDSTLGVAVLALETLPRADSVALLQMFLASAGVIKPSPRAAEAGKTAQVPATLDALAKVLGDLPLALHVAGSYLSRYAREVSPEQYLEQLRGRDPLAHRSLQQAVGRSPTQHDLSVARTFALSYERLDPAGAADRLALDLLARAACFAPGEPILRGLLVATLQLAGDDPDVPLEIADAFHRLAELGLIAVSENGDPYLHRLLGRFVLSLHADDAAQIAVEAAVFDEAAQLNRAGDPRPLRSWQVHLRHVTDEALRRNDEQTARLANELGYHLKMAGDYGGAKPYYERSLAIYEQVLGEQHPSTATSLNNLGSLLQAMGDYAGAKPYLARSLAIYEQVLGEQHPSTATSLNNLGMLLQDMGDYAGAKPYYERSLAIYEQVLGTRHPLTATGLNNLGSLLKAMGDYAGAKPYFERSLAIREQVLGEQHLDTATSLWWMGVLLIKDGKPDAAKPSLERALSAYTHTLGANHPDTLAVQKWLKAMDEPL